MGMKIVRKLLKWIAVPLVCMMALVIALAGYLVISHNQPLVLPSPTGSYSVGRTEYDWIDGSRIDPLSDKGNEKRELLIWVWYPASRIPAGSQCPLFTACLGNCPRHRSRRPGQALRATLFTNTNTFVCQCSAGGRTKRLSGPHHAARYGTRTDRLHSIGRESRQSRIYRRRGKPHLHLERDCLSGWARGPALGEGNDPG